MDLCCEVLISLGTEVEFFLAVLFVTHRSPQFNKGEET